MTDYTAIMDRIDDCKKREAIHDLSMLAYDLINKLIVAERNNNTEKNNHGN